MARIRTVKPEFWTNSTTGRLSPHATKLFLGLHNHCDDYGVIRWDPAEFKARIMPYERSQAAVDKALHELATTDPALILHFSYCTRRYLWMPFFTEHQIINRPSKPLLDGWDTVPTPYDYDGLEWLNQADPESTHGALSEDSLHTHSRARGRASSPLPSTPVLSSSVSTSRERNEEWDALASVFGYSPGGSEAKEWGKLCVELRTLHATPASIAEASRRYDAHMPDVAKTPRALVKHYQRLLAGRPSPEPSRNGHTSKADRTLALAHEAQERERHAGQ